MKYYMILALCAVAMWCNAQPNCNVYKMNGDDSCYEACELAIRAGGGQGWRVSQEDFDKAIEMCPTLDYAWREKSVPYLKRGDFVTWKKLIDKAVELDPILHLGGRGWCKYQFLRDYEGAIRDFERLELLLPDIGYSVNGDYHLTIAKALCYKAIGQKQKAIAIIEQQLQREGYSPFLFDHLHLGVLKIEVGDIDGAIDALKKSIAINDYLAEPYYYLGRIYADQSDLATAREYFEKAKAHYLKGYRRQDPYTHPMDKIYLADIDAALASKF